MNEKKLVWFENVNSNQLFFDVSLVEYDDEPIIFVCSDCNKDKYLCVCYEISNGFKWIVTKTDVDVLLQLWEKKISFYKLLNQASGNKYKIEKDMPSYIEKCEQVQSFEDNMLPEKDVLLEICYKETEKYFKQLRIEKECSDEFAVTRSYTCNGDNEWNQEYVEEYLDKQFMCIKANKAVDKSEYTTQEDGTMSFAA